MKTIDSIKYIDRESNKLYEEDVPGKGMLKWLYGSSVGKASLNTLFRRKVVTSLGGWYMDRSWSRKRIPRFVDRYDIDLSHFVQPDGKGFRTFNDFFYRKVKPEKRPIGQAIVSPADGRVLAFQPLEGVNSFFIKGSEFSVETFLENRKLAEKYKGGSMVIVRLAPTDYHRFHFPADGEISETKSIKGRYYSVSPLALQKNLRIFCQNHRAHSTLATEKYGDILIAEVGATMVGSIVQSYAPNAKVEKGQEKGYFAFGGSTVILFFEAGKVVIDKDLIANTQQGHETKVNVGATIAQSPKNNCTNFSN